MHVRYYGDTKCLCGLNMSICIQVKVSRHIQKDKGLLKRGYMFCHDSIMLLFWHLSEKSNFYMQSEYDCEIMYEMVK